jgi:hypothetical protein
MDAFRIQPALAVGDYQTYSITAPLSTHFRRATCAEVDCAAYLSGWRVRVEGLPPQLLHVAKTSGRRYVEQSVAEGETWLVFEAGQLCFKESEHRVRIDRPELYVVRDGDWRGNPTGRVRQHTNAADWVEDFGEHQQRIADQIDRG